MLWKQKPRRKWKSFRSTANTFTAWESLDSTPRRITRSRWLNKCFIFFTSWCNPSVFHMRGPASSWAPWLLFYKGIISSRLHPCTLTRRASRSHWCILFSKKILSTYFWWSSWSHLARSWNLSSTQVCQFGLWSILLTWFQIAWKVRTFLHQSSNTYSSPK